jgi:hypothetical protein
VYTDLVIAEIHQAINKLGGSAQPATPDEAQLALRDLSADIDLRSIVDSWQDTLPDEQILHLLRNWNAGLPLFQTTYASKARDDDHGARLARMTSSHVGLARKASASRAMGGQRSWSYPGGHPWRARTGGAARLPLCLLDLSGSA